MAAGYQEWEYKIVWKSYGQESSDGKVRNKLSTRGFDELGKEGWELVSATSKKLYFKRPVLVE